MLLSQADSIELLDPSEFPHVSIRERKSLKGLSELAYFTRPIGDFDYVETPAYKNAKRAIPSYSKDPKGYKRERKKFLFKGGGGPSIDELPDSAKEILAEAKSGHKVMCDPVSTYGEDRVAKVTIQNRDYFIADPRQIFGYKVLHLMQNFDKKPKKFNRDFTILHDALRRLYTEEELIDCLFSLSRI